ncbi:MAG: flagellar basal body P-ring formation chaperone FlgA [Gemmatimonadota bacterium]
MSSRTGCRWFLLLVVQGAAAMVAGRSLLQAQAGAPPSLAVDSRAVDSVDVWVAARSLARGTVLTAGDITVLRVAQHDRFARHPTAVVPGWVARRIIRAGEVLRAPAVGPAPLVAAGQTVQFTYQQDGIELTLDGLAPVAGSLGDTIPVRLGARRRVTGVVAGPAHVVALAPSRFP